MEEPDAVDVCCGEGEAAAGRCVRRQTLEARFSAEELALLGSDRCSGVDALCVPSAWLSEDSAKTRLCYASGSFEGRCVPSCLPMAAERGAMLEQSECAGGEVCLHCYDPRDASATGVCTLGDDLPREPAIEFKECCQSGDSALGRCVAREALQSTLSIEEQSRLGADSCTTPDRLCVPQDWLSDRGPSAAACRTSMGVEGRCLPGCLPEVTRHARDYTRQSCATGELCVPCYGVLDGAPTGACTLRNDQPREPGRGYAMCCGALGRCVPRDVAAGSLDESVLAWLDQEGCADPGTVCTPVDWIARSDAVPTACRAAGDLEGRCLPQCLQLSASSTMQLEQRDCSTGQLCAACYDPLDGTDTHACRVGDDSPKEPARRFDDCCGEGSDARGRCLPADWLSEDQRARLSRERCDDSDARCAPLELLFPDRSPSSCVLSTLLSSEPGLCVNECFLTSQDSLLGQRANCDYSERCIACSSGGLPPGSNCP
jgi:hypothetical protein